VAEAQDFRVARSHVYDSQAEAPEELYLAVYEALIRSGLAGRWDVMPGGPLGYAAEDDPFDLPFDEAVAWWRKREVVTDDEWVELDSNARFDAFRVAGVTDRRLLDRMHRSLGQAIEEGAGVGEFVAEVDDAIAEMGGSYLDLHHIDTVFTNAVNQAYAAGRYDQMVAGAEGRPIWTYHTVGDSNVRPTHAAMDGFSARWDDPIWRRWYPPNGHRCRCSVDSGPSGGFEPDTRQIPNPDNGWDRSPALAGEARDAANGVAQWTEPTGILPAGVLDRGTLVEGDAGDRAGAHRRAMQALSRSRDAVRRTAIAEPLALEQGEAAALLREADQVSLYPPGWSPATDGPLRVEAQLASQDRWAVEGVARSVVHSEDLTHLRYDLDVQARVTIARGRPFEAGPQVVLDSELAAELGDELPAIWASEAGLVVQVTGPAEARRVLQHLVSQTERASGRVTQPFARELADARVVGKGAERAAGLAAYDGGAVVEVWLNTRKTSGGWLATALSREPLAGWDHHRVAVNKALADTLPGGSS